MAFTFHIPAEDKDLILRKFSIFTCSLLMTSGSIPKDKSCFALRSLANSYELTIVSSIFCSSTTPSVKSLYLFILSK